MTKNDLAKGVVHDIPDDLSSALLNNQQASIAWQSITPLARNEWICWTISVKKQITRDDHVRRVIVELTNGKRRPCCWAGCIHR
jgi:uncharacterized protein YdeI (YjbR/CyaY-like superfamily)